MNSKIRCVLTYRFECGVCGLVHTQPFVVRPGDCVPMPSPPPGWREVANTTMCPTHAVTADIRIDGEPWRAGVDL